ncbi:MAG: hypothetical protein ACKVZ6_01900 [Kineosporiaceae bacterium]
MTVQPLPSTASTSCPECGGTLVDMGLRPADDGVGQVWVFMCTGCRHDVVHQHVGGS